VNISQPKLRSEKFYDDDDYYDNDNNSNNNIQGNRGTIGPKKNTVMNMCQNQ